MNFFDFMGAHPFLTLMLTPAALLATWTIANLAQTPFLLAFKAYNRRLRHKNIAAKGWPPSHLDADGDFKS